MKKKTILFIICILLLTVGFISHNYKKSTLKTPNGSYHIKLADNEELRTKGLSGMSKLDKDTFMLFTFDEVGNHGIWMKDMLFNIDIIYLDKDWVVINYYDDVSPGTYPTVFYPERPASYVLEMNSGDRIKSGIDKNTKVYYK